MARSNFLKEHGLVEYRYHMGSFDYPIFLVIGDYSKAGEYVIKHIFKDSFNVIDSARLSDDPPRGMTWMTDGYAPMMWIPRIPQSNREVATLAHECLHALYYMFKWANIQIDNDDSELVAHCLGSMMTAFLDKMGYNSSVPRGKS